MTKEILNTFVDETNISDIIIHYKNIMEDNDLIKMYNHNWTRISCHHYLTMGFLERYADKLNWKLVCVHQILTEDFMKNNSDKLIWEEISWAQNLSEDFILDFKDKLDWNEVSWSQKLSTDFIRQNRTYINFQNLFKTHLMPDSFKREFL